MTDQVTTLLGQAAWTRDPERAAWLYRRALKRAGPGSETHVEAGRGLGAALEKLDPGQALDHYRRILAGNQAGAHTYAYERVPILAEKRDDYATALEVVRLAVRRRVSTDVAFRRRAWRIADAAGTPRPFVPYRPLPWRADERLVEMLWYYAEMARDRKAWGVAAGRYGRVAPGTGRYAEAQTWLGVCRERLKDVAGALAAYGRAVTCYEDEHRQNGAHAVVWRKPFDRLIVLYERQGDLPAAMGVVGRTLAVAQRKPPDSWWARVERIAGEVGEVVDREGWEARFRTRMERVVEGVDRVSRRKWVNAVQG